MEDDDSKKTVIFTYMCDKCMSEVRKDTVCRCQETLEKMLGIWDFRIK